MSTMHPHFEQIRSPNQPFLGTINITNLKSMLDIRFIRENTDLVKMAATKKHITIDIDKLIKLDDERRELQLAVDSKRAAQNEVSNKVATISDHEERNRVIAEMKELKEELQGIEEKLKKVFF